MPVTALLEPTAALIENIAPRLKPSDVKAIQIFGIEDPARALRLAYERGEVLFVGAIDGQEVCVVSVIPKEPNAYTPVDGREGSIWMVTTPKFSEAPVAVLKRSKKIIEGILGGNGRIQPRTELRGYLTDRPVATGLVLGGLSASPACPDDTMVNHIDIHINPAGYGAAGPNNNPLPAGGGRGWECPDALVNLSSIYTCLDTVIDRANATNIRYARFLGFEDWGAHYDTVIEGVRLGYFRKERVSVRAGE